MPTLTGSFPTPRRDTPEDTPRTRELGLAAASAMQGKINAVLPAWTMAANVTSTVMNDPRLAASSFVWFDPLTANAASELAFGPPFIAKASRLNGSWVVTHSNLPSTDRTFRILIIG